MAGGQRLISWLHSCSTNKVVLNMCTQHSWATTGPHPNWARCHTHPLKEPVVLVGPTHPHWANVQERSPLAHARTSRRHMPCRVSLTRPTRVMRHMSAHWPVRDAQPRGSALIPFVTPRPQHHTARPFRGASPLTHSISLTLSSSLRVKGSTRRCYGWRTKAYKLTPLLLN